MSCSFVELPSKKVIELASACLDRIQEHKDRAWEDLIRQELESFDRSWIRRRIFRRPTEKELRKSLKREVHLLMSPAYLIDTYGWGSKEAAEKLLVAARYADSVQVSVADLDLIA